MLHFADDATSQAAVKLWHDSDRDQEPVDTHFWPIRTGES